MNYENKQTTTQTPEQIPFAMNEVLPDPEAQAKRGWEVELNGEAVDVVTDVSLKHPKMGIEVRYGRRPEGYDGIVIREPGGAATLPYMIDESGQIYVGVVKEYRPTMGEAVTTNIPRGFSDFKGQTGQKETGLETATRELKEETGFKALGNSMIMLAEGMNPNSTYFDYSHDKSEGVSLFAVEVPKKDLELVSDNGGNVFYVFPAHVRSQAEGDKPAERILGSQFVPLAEALKSRDMFTSAATGQLVAKLLADGEYLLPQNGPKAKSPDLAQEIY